MTAPIKAVPALEGKLFAGQTDETKNSGPVAHGGPTSISAITVRPAIAWDPPTARRPRAEPSTIPAGAYSTSPTFSPVQ